MRKNQAGGVRVGKEKIWTLAYADDIALLANEPKDLKDMIRRFGTYLERKGLQLNAEKSKVLIFHKGRGKKKREEWGWQGHNLEEVKEFKYLGYNFQKNGGREMHIREVIKKARIAMAQIWGIGQRMFKNNFERRMRIFPKHSEKYLAVRVRNLGMDGSRKDRENTGEIYKVDFRFGLQYTSVSNLGGNKNGQSKDRSGKKSNKIRGESETAE